MAQRQKVNVGLRLLPEVVEWLDAEAERRAMTRAGVASDTVHRVWLKASAEQVGPK